jgi:hypothetical protein
VVRPLGKKLQKVLVIGRDGWSEFSVENSRSPASRQISRTSRGIMASAFEGFKLKRSRSVDSSQQEPLDLTVDFYFEIFVSGSPEIFASGLMKS